MRREPEAVSEFQTTLEMAPCHVEAMRRLGLIALKNGDRAAALRQFRGVLARHPDDGEAKDTIVELMARRQKP
jgi:predicted TPR repeat methyltransferase